MEKLKDNLPLITVAIIGLGYIRLSTYYRYFNIRIIDYLQVSEILTSFLDSLAALFMFSLLMLGYRELLVRVFRPFKPTSSDILITKKLSLLLKAEIKLETFISDYFFPVCIGLVFLYFAYIKYETLEVFKYFLVLIFGIILLTLLVKRLRDTRDFSYTNLRFVTAVLLFGAVFMQIFGNIQAIDTTSDYKTGKFNITLADTSFTTSKYLVYIGKTEKYLFLFDTRTETSTAYPAETIKEVKYIPVKKREQRF